ncbi:hypothetical protein QLQ15_05210 [Lysobacter sp. LF1]|uniref:Peptidase M61 catalytic domain-containing protein n=1 Tax=Lysobacter stagni TaxID=3045172 RepID=A0ABT6XE29_9GAMM|nr:hypothetical protein [Lysobacter sp. LF1]MDI9238309.1 hypothetical protein [Lysobacter sp. LF1]
MIATRCRWLCGALLAAAMASAWAQEVPDAERVLRAGDSELRVSVVEVDDPQRRKDLQDWLADVARATLTAFGRYPLPSARVRIMQIDSDDESPVPWGQTRRRGDAAVLLYVRRDASVEELRADWTAVHELSHLFHPYLGDDGRWLAEGLASYYQNVLRARAGMLTPEQAWRLLDAGFGRGRREDSGVPLTELARRHRGTMRVYWAGAAFWLEADIALRRDHDTSLDEVLARYSACCLRGVGEVPPRTFLASLDELSRSRVFSTLYERYADSRTFPPLDAAYRALAIDTADGALEFEDGRPAALRRSIMARGPGRPAAP